MANTTRIIMASHIASGLVIGISNHRATIPETGHSYIAKEALSIADAIIEQDAADTRERNNALIEKYDKPFRPLCSCGHLVSDHDELGCNIGGCNCTASHYYVCSECDVREGYPHVSGCPNGNAK